MNSNHPFSNRTHYDVLLQVVSHGDRADDNDPHYGISIVCSGKVNTHIFDESHPSGGVQFPLASASTLELKIPIRVESFTGKLGPHFLKLFFKTGLHL